MLLFYALTSSQGQEHLAITDLLRWAAAMIVSPRILMIAQ